MTKVLPQKEKRQFTDDFKRQMVQLYQNGKRRCDIIKAYDLVPSVLSRWIREHSLHQGFGVKHTRSEEEKTLLARQKENRRLLMENDILKQAALIMGRQSH